MTAVCETWMPVSDTLREYPLLVDRHDWEMGPVYSAKGHHDPQAFLTAVIEEWAAENDDSLVVYADNTWYEMEGPVCPPRSLRRPERVRHEWWATRMHAQVMAEGYSYAVEVVQPWERGAYPVTVVEL